MSDGYDIDRDKVQNHERGRIFENGTYQYFRDRESGYVQQSRIFTTDKGRVQFDKIRDDRGLIFTIEEKSGIMAGTKDETQLKALRVLLDKGVVQQHTLRTVEGEFRSNKVQKLIDRLIRDFPDKFNHQEISRETAREIWAIGLQRETGKQIELPGVREKAREGKAQALEKRREKIAELAKARERAEKFRNMLRFRDGATRGRADAPQRIEREQQAKEQEKRAREARLTPEAAERARVAREAAERVAREFPVPSQYQEREAATPEAADAASAERAAAEARAAAAEKEREAAARALDDARNAAYRKLDAEGRLSEVEKLLWVGQARHPQEAVMTPPGQAPSVVRGGTGHGPERARGITRDR
ncbi:hypothetical protein [Nocardia abscessus]|uniref:hypothetical protein n=1 Tax=Nocardia abscessus TaxID=120957 RepID=UPI0024554F36|nr:hypothetical protein [Nocardia abscessus]